MSWLALSSLDCAEARVEPPSARAGHQELVAGSLVQTDLALKTVDELKQARGRVDDALISLSCVYRRMRRGWLDDPWPLTLLGPVLVFSPSQQGTRRGEPLALVRLFLDLVEGQHSNGGRGVRVWAGRSSSGLTALGSVADSEAQLLVDPS